jgi:hypothetical protein
MDIELAESIHSLKFLETIERYLASTSDELQQLGAFFLVKGSYSSPEPLNLRGRGTVIVILSIILPVIHIDIRKAGDE